MIDFIAYNTSEQFRDASIRAEWLALCGKLTKPDPSKYKMRQPLSRLIYERDYYRWAMSALDFNRAWKKPVALIDKP